MQVSPSHQVMLQGVLSFPGRTGIFVRAVSGADLQTSHSAELHVGNIRQACCGESLLPTSSDLSFPETHRHTHTLLSHCTSPLILLLFLSHPLTSLSLSSLSFLALIGYVEGGSASARPIAMATMALAGVAEKTV